MYIDIYYLYLIILIYIYIQKHHYPWDQFAPPFSTKYSCMHVSTSFWEFFLAVFRSGVPDRASRKLFTKDVLFPGAGKYPEPSQKIVSATASRYFILWASSMMHFLLGQWGNQATEHMMCLRSVIQTHDFQQLPENSDHPV